jgi:hypothetical protein
MLYDAGRGHTQPQLQLRLLGSQRVSDRLQLMLFMGGFFVLVIGGVIAMSIISLRRTRENAEVWHQYFASVWTGTITALQSQRVHRWWGDSSGGRANHPHTVIEVRYQRDDGGSGTFHVSFDEKTSRDDPGFAYHFDFKPTSGVGPPNAAPPFAEVQSQWRVGDRIHKPSGVFYPMRLDPAAASQPASRT